MQHPSQAIPDESIPRAKDPLFQHLLDTYASETNKVISTWQQFSDVELSYRPDGKSRTVLEILQHQLLSERRFFGEFVGTIEPEPAQVLPSETTIAALCERMSALAKPRLSFFASQDPSWWIEERPFFDTVRQRIWIFWRRVLHTAHHRTQLTMYLRMLDRAVPSTYGPTADVTWKGADPTNTVEAAGRG